MTPFSYRAPAERRWPVAVCALAAIAQASTAPRAEADISVVASIKPVHSLAAAVMKGVSEPLLIVGGAASPHNYSLKPSQAASLQSADVIFWIGHGMEGFLEKPIDTIGAEAVSAALADAPGVERLKAREGGLFEDDGHDHGHDHEGDGHALDTHVWLDPENAKAMAAAMAETLATADPDNAARYQDNLAKLNGELDALIATSEAMLTPVRNGRFLVFHDAYHHFERRFGLEAAGSITVSPETPPGAERLSQIRASLLDTGIDCIFTEPQYDPKLVGIVTEGTDLQTGSLDPLGADLEPGAALYGQMIGAMAEAMRDCLGAAN